MFLRLFAYGPGLLGFLGASFVAIAALWSAYRQANFNAELRLKNEKIISLQDESIKSLKGSDVCYFFFSLTPDENGKFPLFLENPSKIPVYDVDISIHMSTDNPDKMQSYEKWTRVHIGTVNSGIGLSSISLTPGNWQINIVTRCFKMIELVSFLPIKTGFGQHIVVTDAIKGGVIHTVTSPDDFVPPLESFQ